ncbi:hypothetical protein RLV_0016 (plasmid) [Rhizobium leguminosarum bv. viciae]|nr:hypothetical protein RLV_0016 [Rhizobium leguminosarum bv. viciae]
MTAGTEAGGFPARAIPVASPALPNPFRPERRPNTGTAGSSAGIATPRLAITYGQMLPCVNIFYSLRLKCNAPQPFTPQRQNQVLR